MNRVLVDTSAILALINRNDSRHHAASEIARFMLQERMQPFLTNYLVAEAYTTILSRINGDIARLWLQSQHWPVIWISAPPAFIARTALVRLAASLVVSPLLPAKTISNASILCRRTLAI